jgi:hypothetical protein
MSPEKQVCAIDCADKQNSRAVGEGFEHTTELSRETDISSGGGAESGALLSDSENFPHELRLVIDAWEILPESTKIGILAMVRAADRANE